MTYLNSITKPTRAIDKIHLLWRQICLKLVIAVMMKKKSKLRIKKTIQSSRSKLIRLI